MAKCKDCIHFEICSPHTEPNESYPEVGGCSAFKNKGDFVQVVQCKDCKHWHEETSWCTKHSHFIGFDGMACHPSQSSEWKMFDADDFCSYGERREGE